MRELGLEENVRLRGFIPIDAVPGMIATADVGVVPYRRNPFTDLLYPTKAFEYIVMGVPTVMSRSGAVVELFHNIADMFVQPEDVQELAARLLELYREPGRRRRLLEAAQRAYAPYGWESQRQTYLAVMEGMAAKHAVASKPEVL